MAGPKGVSAFHRHQPAMTQPGGARRPVAGVQQLLGHFLAAPIRVHRQIVQKQAIRRRRQGGQVLPQLGQAGALPRVRKQIAQHLAAPARHPTMARRALPARLQRGGGFDQMCGITQTLNGQNGRQIAGLHGLHGQQGRTGRQHVNNIKIPRSGGGLRSLADLP